MDQYLILAVLYAVRTIPSQAVVAVAGVGYRGAPTSEGLCLVPGTILTLVRVLPAGLVLAQVNSPEN